MTESNVYDPVKTTSEIENGRYYRYENLLQTPHSQRDLDLHSKCSSELSTLARPYELG